jgi:hypothetical protein
VAAPATSLEALLKHADKFGVKEVYEVGSGCLDVLSLERLRKELQAIARERVRGEWLKRAVELRQSGLTEKQVLAELGVADDGERVKLLRRTLQQIAKAVRNGRGRPNRAELAATLRAKGLTTVEIGAELGVSARHAQRLLSEHDRAA